MRGLNDFVPRRILVCQQRQLGDVLLATPALELLRRRFPHADIRLFTEAKCEPLVRGNPHVDGLLLVEKKLSFPAQLIWYHRAAGQGFDLAVDFQQLPRCRMMVRFSRARVRLSFPPPWYRTFLYTHHAPVLPGYAAASKASVLAPLGIVWKGEIPRLYLCEREKEEAHALLTALGLGADHRLITVDPTHRRASKRWPLDRWAATLDLMAAAMPDLRFFLLRGPGEDEQVQELRERCVCRNSVFLPAEPPDLRLSAAVIGRADLHLGTCSAPRHMAVAMQTPSLVIPGASGPEWLFPHPLHQELSPALPCRPCSRLDCPDPHCLSLITPHMAAEAALKMLGES